MLFSQRVLSLDNCQKQPLVVFCKKRCFFKKKKFAIFTGKYLCWNLLFIKLQTWTLLKVWRPADLLKAWNFIKKWLQHRCFPVNIRPQPLNCLVRVSFSRNTLAGERMEAKKIGFFEKEHIHTASWLPNSLTCSAK